MGVPHERRVVVRQDVPYGCVAAVPKVQRDVLGEGARTVCLGRPLDEQGDTSKFVRVETADNLDPEFHRGETTGELSAGPGV